MGNVGMVALRPLAIKLRDFYDVKHFVETGTYRAQTTTWAANNFEHVTTIEAHEPAHEYATGKCAHLLNVRCVFGDSRNELSDHLPEDEMGIVWLDAHWCGSYELSAGTPGECPIREELQALNASHANHIVLIDDARYFVEKPPFPHDPPQWPKFAEVKELLQAEHRRKVYIWNDAIIAVPPEAAGIIAEMTGIGADLKVVVLTSNDYQHLLRPFAYLFNKHWSSNQPVTIVRHEIRPRGLPANFTNFSVGVQADYTWSSGMRKYLEYLNEDLFILLLEDYFIDRPVNVKRIEVLWNFMELHPEVVKIDLSGDRLKLPHEDYLEGSDLGLVRSIDDAPFLTSIQAAIWRKDFLLQFLEPSEGPWQFEKKGTGRVIAARRRGEFGGLVLGAKAPPLYYVNAVGGEGNKPGQFDFKKFTPQLTAELNARGML